MAFGNTPLLIGLFFFLVIGALVLMVLMMWMRSHRLRIRSASSGDGSFVEGDYWMIEKKAKDDGSIWWVSVPWQPKLKLPQPPSDVVDIGKKGRKFVEVTQIGPDEFIYMKSKGVDIKKDKLDGGALIKEAFKPFTVVQRETIINQFKKAEAGRAKDIMQQVLQLGPSFMMMMIIIVGVIYWGEIMEANREAAAEARSLIQEAGLVYSDLKSGTTSVAVGVSGTPAAVAPGSEPPKE